MTDQASSKLGLLPLTALVVGGIVGSGIFSLPQNMAEGAGAGAILIAWVITFVGALACGVGMIAAFPVAQLFLVHCYRRMTGGHIAPAPGAAPAY